MIGSHSVSATARAAPPQPTTAAAATRPGSRCGLGSRAHPVIIDKNNLTVTGTYLFHKQKPFILVF